MSNFPVPKIDQLAGIECYCTCYSGTGGLIKQSSEGFKVSEIIDCSVFDNLSPVQDSYHRYPLYILNKKNIDSNHAIFEIKREVGIKLKVIGIKDAKAITSQYASSEQIKNLPKEIKTMHTFLSLKGFIGKPLRKNSLQGNKFVITVYSPKTSDISSFVSDIKNIANFYGLQRFGSERLVTHLVGREIIRRNFKEAVELLLSYTTEYDSALSKEIRHKSRDPKNYSHLLRHLPRNMDIEYQLISAMLNGKEPISALRSIPIGIRRLFVQAYQAYIFNKCLSTALLKNERILYGVEGDLCFEMEGPSVFGRIRRFNPSLDIHSETIPAIRIVGYAFQPGKGRFEIITKNIMDEEGISSRDFYIKEMQELSTQGGFRQAPLCCESFSYAGSLNLSFTLPKGSYATILLRDLMKPKDPIKSGF